MTFLTSTTATFRWGQIVSIYHANFNPDAVEDAFLTIQDIPFFENDTPILFARACECIHHVDISHQRTGLIFLYMLSQTNYPQAHDQLLEYKALNSQIFARELYTHSLEAEDAFTILLDLQWLQGNHTPYFPTPADEDTPEPLPARPALRTLIQSLNRHNLLCNLILPKY